MKILHVGDFHLSSAQVRTRLDNSPDAGIGKLDQVYALARKHNAVVIFSGDFLHNNNNSTEFILRIIQTINKYPDVVSYCIAGNHECRGDDPDTYSISQMQLIYGATRMSFLQDAVIDGVHIRGYHAYRELDVTEAEKVNILVCHHFLEESFNDKLICKPSEVKKVFPNLKYILSGHDHAEYAPTEISGVVCLRPGSAMRIDSSQHRQPKVILFDPEVKEEVYQIQLSAEPWDKLFSLEVKDIKKEVDARIEGFITKVTQPTSAVDILGLLREKIQGIPDINFQSYIRQDLRGLGYVV